MTALVCGALLPSLLVAWLAGCYLRKASPRWGLMDQPSPRKIHSQPMPLGGGLAIWLGVLLPLASLQVVVWLTQAGVIPLELWPEFARPHVGGLGEQTLRLWMLLGAGTIVMLLGLADDARGLSWQLRLLVQTAVATGLVCSWEGWRLTIFLDWPVVTGALSVLWMVWLMNSFNMLDNMDGLSAGVAAISAGLLATVLLVAPVEAAAGPQLFVAGLLLVLVGALLGFLFHNSWPARIFMGDAGSYFIGLMLGATTLTATFTGDSLPRHAILAPLCVLAIPLYDTLSVLVIRLCQGRSLVQADSSHFSHRLVRLGLSQRSAVWTIYLAAVTCGLAALLLHQVNTAGAVILLVLVGCLLAIIAILEYASR